MGSKKESRIVVAGHICLDIIPNLGRLEGGLACILTPGKLVEVGRAVLSTGGAVSNTGLALHKLGLPVTLMGKIGNDGFGRIVLDLLAATDPSLAEGMIVGGHDQTSYSVVISPQGVDRTILHCPGANDTFRAEDIDYGPLDKSLLFHFGYPPLMRQMYADGGSQLELLLSQAKTAGAITSLDLALPDPASAAGQVEWPSILAKVLPSVDFLVPSLEEVLFMLPEVPSGSPVSTRARRAAERLLEMGAGAVLLKLGNLGLYLRTSGDPGRLASTLARRGHDAGWIGRELYSPCFEVQVAGTIGSGDSTVAGFLAAYARGKSPAEAMTTAVAVGAYSVEAPDAVSEVPSWDEMKRRIAGDWRLKQPAEGFDAWPASATPGVRAGPADSERPAL